MKNKVYHILTPFMLAVALLFSISAFAQNGGLTYGIQMQLKETQSRIKSDQMARNTLMIINYTNRSEKLSLLITTPDKWQMFGKERKEILVRANDTLYVPLRVRPNARVTGDANYVVNTYLSQKDYTISSSVWYVAVAKQSDWDVSIDNHTYYFVNEKDSIRYQLHVYNYGNSDENLLVKCRVAKNLVFIEENGKIANHHIARRITLPAKL
jgi:hypothetical protein